MKVSRADSSDSGTNAGELRVEWARVESDSAQIGSNRTRIGGTLETGCPPELVRRPSDSRAADRVGPARSLSRMLAVAASGLGHDSSSRLGEGSLVVYYARRVPFACSIINILPSHSVMSQSESSQKTINFEYMNSASFAVEPAEIH